MRQAHTSNMPFCGATTDDGTPCRRRVGRAGQRCYQHRGFGAAFRASPGNTAVRSRVPAPTPTARRPVPRPSPRKPTPPPPPIPARKEVERARVEEAARFCADSLSTTWQDAVADRISDYAGTAWERLKRSRRRRNCKALARLAAAVLEGRQKLHELAGRSFGWLTGRLGAGDVTRAFAAELAANISLGPIDAKAIALARGLQVSGVVLCVMDQNDLTKCQCFIDLALAETKERVQAILVAGMSDWAVLARFSPRTSSRS
jgi:hypothetical protein